MFCPNCGAQTADGAAFCPNCGATIEIPPQQSQQQPQQQPQYQQPQYQPQARQPYQPYQQYPPQQVPGRQLGQPAPKAPFALRLIGAIGAALVIIGVFLPYVEALGYSLSLSDGDDGPIFLVIGALGLIFALTNLGIGQILMGLAAIGAQFIEWDGAPSIASKGAGYYVILIGALALIAGGIVTFVKKRQLKQSQNQNLYQ